MGWGRTQTIVVMSIVIARMLIIMMKVEKDNCKNKRMNSNSDNNHFFVPALTFRVRHQPSSFNSLSLLQNRL